MNTRGKRVWTLEVLSSGSMLCSASCQPASLEAGPEVKILRKGFIKGALFRKNSRGRRGKHDERERAKSALHRGIWVHKLHLRVIPFEAGNLPFYPSTSEPLSVNC